MIIKLVILCFIVLLVFGTLINLLRGRKNLTIQGIKTGFLRLKRRKALICLLAALFFIGYASMEYIEESHISRATLGLNYGEASKGLNPNGTRFNSGEITSEEVVARAMEMGAWEGVGTEDLMECLSVSSAADNEGISTDAPVIATEYTIRYKESDKTKGIDPRNVAKLVANAYYDIFMSRYSANDSILNLEFDDLENLEYIEMGDYFSVKADKLSKYLDHYIAENGSYRSEKTGETFASMQKKITDFSDIELERFYSYVVQNGISRDEAQFMAKENYDNLMMNVSYMKNMSAYNVRLEAIDRYDAEMARIVLVPTNDVNQEFYMSRTKIGVDYFAEEANAALKEATDLKLQIETNDYQMNQISKLEPVSEAYAQAEKMIGDLTAELKSLADVSREMVGEYVVEKQNDYLTIRYDEKELWDKIRIKKVFEYTIVFSILVCVYIVSTGTNPKKERI